MIACAFIPFKVIFSSSISILSRSLIHSVGHLCSSTSKLWIWLHNLVNIHGSSANLSSDHYTDKKISQANAAHTHQESQPEPNEWMQLKNVALQIRIKTK